MKPVIPDWMKVLANDAMIGSSEIAQIYGLNKNHMTRYIEQGKVMQPTERLINRLYGHYAYKWRMGDIRKHVAQFQE